MNRHSVHVFTFPARDAERWITRIEYFYHATTPSNITLRQRDGEDALVPMQVNTNLEYSHILQLIPDLDNIVVTVTSGMALARDVFGKTMIRDIPWAKLKDLVSPPSTKIMEGSVTQTAKFASEMIEARVRLCDSPVTIEPMKFDRCLGLRMFPTVLERIARVHKIEGMYYNPTMPYLMLSFWGGWTKDAKDITRSLRYVRIERKRCIEVRCVNAFDLEDGFCGGGGPLPPFDSMMQDFEEWKKEGSNVTAPVLRLHGPFKHLFSQKRKRVTAKPEDTEKKWRLYCPTH